MPKSLTVVATPIGNLGDLSDRSREALASADLWLVEDSRVSGKLQSHLKFKIPMRVLNDHTNDAQVCRYVDEIESGINAVIVSDGGCPVVSDPGAKLVDLCAERGIPIDAIPGPSAVTTALMLSGYYSQRFAFLGFLPRKPGPMGAVLSEFADSSLTLVIFESQFRIEALLASAHKQLGTRRYCIARELTKMHQQTFRATLPYVPTQVEVPRKGEFTVVIEGKRRATDADE